MAPQSQLPGLQRQWPAMMTFPVGTSGELIELTDQVIVHLERHRQTRWWHCEAGGLLFASIVGKTIKVEVATGPRPTDRRTPLSYWPDRLAEQAEIDDHFERGLHYVGDWHSHPQKFPRPSARDERTMQSRVKLSAHQLNGILFAIIGQAPLPQGLTLMLHDGEEWHELRSTPESTSELASALNPPDSEQPGGIEA